jgi:hypothetical protein
MQDKRHRCIQTDELLVVLLGGALFWLGGCGGASQRAPLQADLALSSADEGELASRLRSLYTPLADRARPMQNDRVTASQPFNLQVETSHGSELLSLQLVRNRAANYPHLRVVRSSTGEHANFLFGGSLSSGITLRLTDDSGQTLRKDGQLLEFSLFDTRQRSRAPQDWIATGIKVAALAFLVWFGAVITRGVAAAVGFVAFNLVVLGLLAAAAGTLLPILRWFLDNSGLSWEGIQRFIEQTLNTLITLLRDVVDWLTRQ